METVEPVVLVVATAWGRGFESSLLEQAALTSPTITILHAVTVRDLIATFSARQSPAR